MPNVLNSNVKLSFPSRLTLSRNSSAEIPFGFCKKMRAAT